MQEMKSLSYEFIWYHIIFGKQCMCVVIYIFVSDTFTK